MTTGVQPFSASHAASSSRPAVVLAKVRTSRVTLPPATRRTAATTVALRTSRPAQSGVLERPRVQLMRGLVCTKAKADLAAGGAAPPYPGFIPGGPALAGGQL